MLLRLENSSLDCLLLLLLLSLCRFGLSRHEVRRICRSEEASRNVSLDGKITPEGRESVKRPDSAGKMRRQDSGQPNQLTLLATGYSTSMLELALIPYALHASGGGWGKSPL
ncbi:hypothetical protein LZ30DRAFT_683044 [Colletotrichum cereale]|nr:hypothetical protein LZ30DRAFT_683044 [Colletotrichum cereale]